MAVHEKPIDLTPVTNDLDNATDGLGALKDAIDTKSLASVVGALDAVAAEDAVTDADTAMAYIKQLVTLLLLVPTTAMRGTDNAATVADGWDSALATILDNFTAARIEDLDKLDAANLPTDAANLLSDTAVIHHAEDSRARVYPQVPSASITLTTHADADTFGAWTQVVPINTIDFDYSPVGVMVESSDAIDVYMIQFGFSLIDGTEPVTAQIVGEQRFKVFGTPIANYHADLALLGRGCPANSKLWARLMSAGGGTDSCGISMVITRHREVTNEITHTTTWPWNS